LLYLVLYAPYYVISDTFTLNYVRKRLRCSMLLLIVKFVTNVCFFGFIAGEYHDICIGYASILPCSLVLYFFVT